MIILSHIQDLYVGAEVVFNNFRFVLVDADEYAFRYMETHVDTFPHANINLILEKLKGPATAHIDKIRSVLSDADPNKTGTLPYETFKLVFCLCIYPSSLHPFIRPPPIHLFIQPSVHASIHPSIHPSIIHPSIHPHIHTSIHHLFIHLSIHSPINLSIHILYTPIHSFIHLSIQTFFHLFDRILVKGLAQGLLNDHEVLTLGRQYGEKKWPPLSSLIRIIQDDMKKKNFTQFE